VAQYDKHLAQFGDSSVKITTSLAFLNSGQNIIFSSALTMAMFLAAQGVVNGSLGFLFFVYLFNDFEIWQEP
jgi:ATP-binding cassette subfamily B (MDR/TAP) protein 7